MKTIHYTQYLILWLFLPFVSQGQIVQTTKVYMDETREQRPIKVEAWFDTQVQHKPLVVMSHGTGGNRLSQSWLAKRLAKDGYFVVALDHFGNTFDNPIPKYFVRFWERPLDVKFVLDNMLNEEEFIPHINFEQAYMIGFSLGGYTTLALAGVEMDCDKMNSYLATETDSKLFYIPEMGDLKPFFREEGCDAGSGSFYEPRFKKFVAMAPALGMFLVEKKTEHQKVLLIGAKKDEITPNEQNAKRYRKWIANSIYREIDKNVGHYVFLNAMENYPTELEIYFKDEEGIVREEIHDEVYASILNFLRS